MNRPIKISKLNIESYLLNNHARHLISNRSFISQHTHNRMTNIDNLRSIEFEGKNQETFNEFLKRLNARPER